ncbi:MAG: SMC-Scp complex subunit ScpB, partial [Planctomycetia bacterium]
LDDAGEARRLVQRLNEWYDADGSAFAIEEIAGGWQLLTRPELRPWLERWGRTHPEAPPTGPMLETLAVVAYRQPINRADVEAVRGAPAGDVLKQLMDRGLVRLAGKDEGLGRPYLYATTPKFLRVFGLRSLNELPRRELVDPPGASSAKGAGDAVGAD